MKFKSVFFALAASLLVTAQADAAEEIAVSLPTFEVTLNGLKYDNSSAEYPLIVYKGITYIPLSWDMGKFMGLNVRFGPYGYRSNPSPESYILYAGNGSIETDSLPAGAAQNVSAMSATVPEYRVVLGCGTDIDNGNEEYPLLNVRGVTYFPLTWHYAYELFDWEYSFDSVCGLVIDSRAAVRPEWDYMLLWDTSPHKSGRTDYVLARHSYAGYPNTTLNGHYSFIYREDGVGEKIFSLENDLSDGDYTFNSAVADGEYGASIARAEAEPYLKDGILTIMCARRNAGNMESVLLTIDMKAGKLIDTTKAG